VADALVAGLNSKITEIENDVAKKRRQIAMLKTFAARWGAKEGKENVLGRMLDYQIEATDNALRLADPDKHIKRLRIAIEIVQDHTFRFDEVPQATTFIPLGAAQGSIGGWR
jgi:hypothetical protein